MKKQNLLLLCTLIVLPLLSSCGDGSNPKFNCEDFTCLDSGTSGIGQGKALSFIEVKEQGYWYSRYNLGSLVMKSGLGETFAPQKSLVQEMVKLSSDSVSQASPAKNPALLKRVFNQGNPQYANKGNGDPRDFQNFRWKNVQSSKTTGSAFGWTLMKEVEWSKLFNVDSHFGVPGKSELPSAQQRFSGLVLCAEALVQADTFFANRQNFDLSKVHGQYVALGALSNLAEFIKTESQQKPKMEQNRCSKVAEMMKGKTPKQISDELMTKIDEFFLLHLQSPETLKDKAYAIRGIGWYAQAKQDRDIFKSNAISIADELLNVQTENPTDLSYVITGLMEAYRVTDEDKYMDGAADSFTKLFKDYDPQGDYFSKQTTYEVDDVAAIFNALNSLKLFANEDFNQRRLLEVMIGFHHSVVNDAKLQVAAPPVSVLPKWEQRNKKDLHRANQLPTPKEVESDYGTAPVFAASVTFEDGGKVAETKSFDTAGAMHLANEMIWLHKSEVIGFPCPDTNCRKPQDIDPGDLEPPQNDTPGNGGGNGGGSGEVPSFAQIHSTLLQRCLMCHVGNNAPQGLDMSTKQKAYQNLVGVEGNEMQGVQRVKPGNADPGHSYIMAKIIEDDSFRIGGRMPLGGAGGFLTSDEIDKIRKWINAGAPNN